MRISIGTAARHPMRLVTSGMICLGVLLFGTSTGCSLSDLVNNSELPSDTQDPNAFKTPVGAMEAYRGAVVAFYGSIGGRMDDSMIVLYSQLPDNFIITSGLLTDELQSLQSRSAVFPDDPSSAIDVRNAPDNVLGASRTETARKLAEMVKRTYGNMQLTRARIREARGALQKYHPTVSPDIIGHLFALEGMVEVQLAELFCSGIPLSTLDFEADFTAKPGSTRDEVFQHAVMLFDSALTHARDSVQIVQLAQVGRARALMNLDDYQAAVRTVMKVPVTHRYVLTYAMNRPNTFGTLGGWWPVTVADVEGENGLPYITSGDPRSLTDLLTHSDRPIAPGKYLSAGADANNNPGTAPIVLTSGIEARLIEAEAALQDNDSQWIVILNTLRTSCTVATTCPTPAPAGLGGVDNLPLLPDPGLRPLPTGKTIHDVRVDLLFQERAYWLFLTGHRQGDLRRLVRQYERNAETVYPTNQWGANQFVPYGEDVNLPLPVEEQETNPLYRGCFNRDA